MTMRRTLAAFTIAALALCFGRVASYAAVRPAAAHACCQAPRHQAAAITDCCPTAAAVVAPRVPVAAPVVAAPRNDAPVATPQPLFIASVDVLADPPGPPGHRAAVPARAPPLA